MELEALMTLNQDKSHMNKYCWTAILHMKGVLFLNFNTPRRKLQLLVKTLSKPEEPFLYGPEPPCPRPPAYFRPPTKKVA